MPTLMGHVEHEARQNELLLKELLLSPNGTESFALKSPGSCGVHQVPSINTTWTDTGGHVVGLGVQAYNPEFDKHFGIDSTKVQIILGNESSFFPQSTPDAASPIMDRRISNSRYNVIIGVPTTKTSATNGISVSNSPTATSGTARLTTASGEEDMHRWKAFFDAKKKEPAAWCLKVRFITNFWSYVASDLEQYAASHCINDQFQHVCMSRECGWHHAEMPAYHRNGTIQQLKPDMHLVVQRYIKPWTEPWDSSGMALVFNAGYVSLHRQIPLDDSSQPAVFISHCWQEDFGSFAKTLQNGFDPETHVWVCSFAIWQHGDVAGQLTGQSLDLCPFAVALAQCQRVMVVTDVSAEALTRCWCVLEASIALKENKPYDIRLDEDESTELWNTVSRKIDFLDIKKCRATHKEDKEQILLYAEHGEGGIEGLNEVVRQVSRKAAIRARIAAAASIGDLTVLKNAHLTELWSLRDARGRGILHMSAMRGQISSIKFIAHYMEECDVDMPDSEGNSALCVAAHVGAIAGVQGLLALKAHVEGASLPKIKSKGSVSSSQSVIDTGLTPLHYAAMGGSTKAVLMLLNHHADVEAEGRYRATFGRRPLHIAAKEGHSEVVRLLIHHHADGNARAQNGATVLWHAVHAGHTNVVTALVSTKADVNLQTVNKFKRSALTGAVKQDSIALVSILLEALADVNLVDGGNNTPLDYANKDTFEGEYIYRLIARAQTRTKGQCKCVIA